MNNKLIQIHSNSKKCVGKIDNLFLFCFCSADGDYIVTTMTKAILHHDGKVKIIFYN